MCVRACVRACVCACLLSVFVSLLECVCRLACDVMYTATNSSRAHNVTDLVKMAALRDVFLQTINLAVHKLLRVFVYSIPTDGASHASSLGVPFN